MIPYQSLQKQLHKGSAEIWHSHTQGALGKDALTSVIIWLSEGFFENSTQ